MALPILYIDDEKFSARHFVEALERAHYSVVFEDSAEGGLRRIRENAHAFSLVILDYMMPTPNGVNDDDTLGGLATGRWVLRQGKDAIAASGIPVMILTNRRVEMVLAELVESPESQLGTRLRVFSKLLISPSQLPAIAAERIALA